MLTTVKPIGLYRRRAFSSLEWGYFCPRLYLELQAPTRTFKVDVYDLVMEKTGWKKMTERRLQALRQALPARLLAAETEVPDWYREGRKWYQLDESGLQFWLAMALQLIKGLPNKLLATANASPTARSD